jgi:hypothetical protein
MSTGRYRLTLPVKVHNSSDWEDCLRRNMTVATGSAGYDVHKSVAIDSAGKDVNRTVATGSASYEVHKTGAIDSAG